MGNRKQHNFETISYGGILFIVLLSLRMLNKFSVLKLKQMHVLGRGIVTVQYPYTVALRLPSMHVLVIGKEQDCDFVFGLGKRL
jgi:hypothetical protein